jgi:hypothetical protein
MIRTTKHTLIKINAHAPNALAANKLRKNPKPAPRGVRCSFCVEVGIRREAAAPAPLIHSCGMQ